MNHDIAHCDKQDCPKKETCYRYQAHLESKSIGLEYVSYFIIDAEILKPDGSCSRYWNIYNR